MNKNLFLLGLGAVAIVGAGIVFSAVGQQKPSSAQTKTISYQKDGVTRALELKFVGKSAIDGARFVFGSSSAKNTVVEFADYQCPACAVFATQYESEFKSKFVDTGRVRYAYRDFPLPQHDHALLAAKAAACAATQNKFETYKAMLYRSQGQWSELSSALAKQNFLQIADYASLEPKAFASCLDNNSNDTAIATDEQAGREAQLEATPSFVVNGYLVSGALPPEAFEAILKAVGE